MPVEFKEPTHGQPAPSPFWFWAGRVVIAGMILACLYYGAKCLRADPVKPADVLRVQADISTDASGAYVPVPATPAVRQAIADALNPPPVTLPPPTTARRKLIASEPRPAFGVQLIRGGPQVLADRLVSGYGRNISYEHVASLTVSDVITISSYRIDPKDLFGGQNLYVDDIPGPVVIRNVLSGWGGWRVGLPIGDRSIYRHGGYFNFKASPPDIDGWISCQIPNSGIQTRNGGHIRNAVEIDCGIGLLNSMGELTVEDTVIYGGSFSRLTDKHGPAWVGNVGVCAYWPVHLRHVWIVARPGQQYGDSEVRADVKANHARVYPGPAIQSNLQKADTAHPEWHSPPGGSPRVTCEDVHIVGWPGEQFGGSGWPADKRGKPVVPAGVTIHPAPVDYDPYPVIAEVVAGRMGTAEAVVKIQGEIKARVK